MRLPGATSPASTRSWAPTPTRPRQTVWVFSGGVGGIEAEAAALGQPVSMLVPPVVELRLVGSLRVGVSGMDLALAVAQLMRREGVVGCLVEVTGEGVSALTATQRSCVANMTPEYGATTTLFPVDDVTMGYLELTGRAHSEVAFARAYLEAQGVFGDEGNRVYARTVTFDLSSVELSLAGPSRPHDRVAVADLRRRFEDSAVANGRTDLNQVFDAGRMGELHHGAVAIAAITSCTTATDPAMMVAAGLVAAKARERGLMPKPWVKTILAPGSHATELILRRAGLLEPLRELGFFTCGFGCMSCIGNSGEIKPELKAVSRDVELTSVLSGNRNFEGRISPDVSQNYLCQPALVVAYAIAGTMDVDLSAEPVGCGSDGTPVSLADHAYRRRDRAGASRGRGPRGLRRGCPWASRGIGGMALHSCQRVRYLPVGSRVNLRAQGPLLRHRPRARGHRGARVLALLGDFVTTDHISPAGAIAADSPAARYLERGVSSSPTSTPTAHVAEITRSWPAARSRTSS